MTEQEWLSCTSPEEMLDFLRGKASDRKLRLFAVACCRRVWRLFHDLRSRQAIEVAEGFADGGVSKEELQAARKASAAVITEMREDDYISTSKEFNYATVPEQRASHILEGDAHLAAQQGLCIASDMGMFPSPDSEALEVGETKAELAFVLDVFGNPFHVVSADPAWLTPTVVALARAAYDHRSLPAGTLDHGRLAILADALEDAGCDQAAILDHCREPGQHVRGCWVVDLVVGKS